MTGRDGRGGLLTVELGDLRLHLVDLSGRPHPRPAEAPTFRVLPEHAAVSRLEPGAPALFEETDYELTIEGRPEQVDALELRTLDEALLARLHRPTRAPVLLCPLRLRGYVGELPLDLFLSGRRVLSLVLEVFPTKLSYRQDHRALVDSVADHERTLPFELVAPTAVGHGLGGDAAEATSTEWLAMLRHEAPRLARVLRALQTRPSHQLRAEALVRPASQVRRAGARSAAWLARHPEHARRGRPPARLIDERRLVSHDTAENRFVVGRVRAWCRRLGHELRHEPRLAGGLREVEGSLSRFLSEHPWSALRDGPRPTSHVLLHDPAYRAFARVERALRRSVERAHAGQVPLTLKALHRLYEYWVLLEVHRALVGDLGFVCEAGGPATVRAEAQADLLAAGRLDYVRTTDGARASLTYQGLFAEQPDEDEDDLGPPEAPLGELTSHTAAQHPDGVLVLRLTHVRRPVYLVLDAKYRLGRHGVGPRVADVNVMHRYRDALVHAVEVPGRPSDVVQPVSRAWFVYPGDPTGLELPDEDARPSAGADPRERLWRAAFSVGVGAIPALPGRADLLRRALVMLATTSPRALERTRPRTLHPSHLALRPDSTCLWAVVPSQARLETSEATGLYHVPTDVLPDAIGLDFLLLGVRDPVRSDGDSRQVVLRPVLHRVSHLGAWRRDELPVAYLRRLGSPSRGTAAGRYHLFQLGERFELEAVHGLRWPTTADALFARRSLRETLALMSSGWEPDR